MASKVVPRALKVKVLSPLTEKCLCVLQFTVRASDQALPTPKTTDVQVTVSVPRDIKLPEFRNDEYKVTVNEDNEVGDDIIEIRADDDNLKVCGMLVPSKHVTLKQWCFNVGPE